MTEKHIPAEVELSLSNFSLTPIPDSHLDAVAKVLLRRMHRFDEDHKVDSQRDEAGSTILNRDHARYYFQELKREIAEDYLATLKDPHILGTPQEVADQAEK